MKPRPCPMCGVQVTKPKDELVVGMLTYCTATCLKLHLPSEYRRVRSLLLRMCGTKRMPDTARALLSEALALPLEERKIA